MRCYALVRGKDDDLALYVVEDEKREKAHERINWAFPRPAEVILTLDDMGLANLRNLLENAKPLKEPVANPNGSSWRNVGEWTIPPRVSETPRENRVPPH